MASLKHGYYLSCCNATQYLLCKEDPQKITIFNLTTVKCYANQFGSQGYPWKTELLETTRFLLQRLWGFCMPQESVISFK